MKKTIVAAAVAAVFAAPAAMADVKISGQLNAEFFQADSSTAGSDSGHTASDMNHDLNTDIIISGSEDLGNGMTASFKLGVSPDGNATAGGAYDDQIISLSGDFGKISVGSMETFIENKVNATAANDTSDTFGNEVGGSGLGQRAAGTIEYVSPNFNGVTVYASARANEAANTSDWDTTSIGVAYSNGALTVMAASADGETANTDETAFAVKYTMGDLTLAAVSNENGSTDEEWYGASYTMGANTFAVSTLKSDTAASERDTISVKHALSKRTSVGLTHLNDSTNNEDVTVLTVAHSF